MSSNRTTSSTQSQPSTWTIIVVGVFLPLVLILTALLVRQRESWRQIIAYATLPHTHDAAEDDAQTPRAPDAAAQTPRASTAAAALSFEQGGDLPQIILADLDPNDLGATDLDPSDLFDLSDPELARATHFTLDLRRVPLADALVYIASISGQPILFDHHQVAGRTIFLQAARPVTVSQGFAMLLAALQRQGLTIVQEDAFYRVVPSRP